MLDTVRADHLPVYGHPRDTAPFLAQLAADGVVFDHARAASSWTAPSVATLFTSVHPIQHGMIHGFDRTLADANRVDRLPSTLETIPEALRKAGYATFAVSDNLYVSPLTGFDAGFDRFSSTSDASADVVNARISALRPELERSRPYFLYVQYMDAHEPYARRAPWFDRFREDGVDDVLAAYDSEIRAIDERLRTLSDAMGWERDAVLIVTADHGEEFGEHHGQGHGANLHEEVLRVPLIVHAPPGVLAPGRVARTVGLIDVLPTVRALAGLGPDPRNEGANLRPLLEDRWRRRDQPPRAYRSHLLAFGTGELQEAVVEGRWKAIRAAGATMLFDLEADPGERSDVARRHGEVVSRLNAASRAFTANARRYAEAPVEARISAETRDQLRALGYLR